MKAPTSSSFRVVALVSLIWCIGLTCLPSAAMQFGHRGAAQTQRRQAQPQGPAGPEQILYTFQGGTDGGVPSGNLIFDAFGNLYGETQFGGTGSCTDNYGHTGCGTVFELSPNGNGGWSETILYEFTGGSDGANPSFGLIFDSSGNLYGTTVSGGDMTYDYGTVFELSPKAGGGWTETVLYAFGTSGINDAAEPQGVIFDKSGNLYGTTASGGNPECDHDAFQSCGTVFQLAPNGSSGWNETIVYAFPSGDANGYEPNGALTFDQFGNLYGTTQLGGAYNCEGSGGCGTVFELSPNGSGGWNFSLIYSFQGGANGEIPIGSLVLDQSGNLYGTSLGGPQGWGMVFQLAPDGSGGWAEMVLYTFQDGNDGAYPSGLISDAAGNLYGVTGSGGSNTSCPSGCGTVFELGLVSLTWTESTLYAFQGVSDGQNPNANLVFDSTGHLYGTTYAGGGTGCGGSGCGTAFEITKEPFPTFFPAGAAFGQQMLQTTSAPQMITLTNSGGLPLTISSIQTTGSSEFAQTNNCPESLASNGSCKINVTFSPTILGNATAALGLTDNAPGSPQSVPLTGTGIAFVSSVLLSPSNLTFPGQYVGTTGLPQNVLLTNNGSSTLAITSVVTGPTDFAALSSCGSSVLPGASCSIGIFFDPSTGGARNGTLTVSDNALGSPQTVALAGSGEDFSMPGSAPSQTISAGQTATYTLTIAPEGGFKQTVQLSCGGGPAGSTCSVTPPQMMLNGSSAQNATVTVNTAGMTAKLGRTGIRGERIAYAVWLGFSGMLGLVMFVLPAGSRRATGQGSIGVLGLLCVLAILMMPACGGGNGSGSTGTTYNVTVTGAFTSGSTTLTHQTNLTLVVH